MIRNTTNVMNKSNRAHSNSQENSKLKKSSSGGLKNLNNISHLGNSITSSIKTRVQTSTSNKKTILNSSSSNKSLKPLRDNQGISQGIKALNTSALNSNKKKQDKENKQIKDDKKYGIMIKNIKNKIVGNVAATRKTEKQNNFQKIDVGSQFLRTKIQTNNKTPKTPRSNIKSIMSACRGRNEKRLSAPVELSLDMFQLGRKLGKGRFGDVYMAQEVKTGFLFAIKMISKKQLKQSEMESQLIQEIKIQMYANHPNVLKMYGFFSDSAKIYLLLELATNGCLYKEIRKKAYFSEDLACYYFRQVSSGMRYLHSNYVIHRDIKPENILNSFNVLKICDFGWAIYSPIYQRQTFCGTLDYVPPEIVTGEFYDEKADVWCLGVLCYELCTGKAPFESKTDENQTYNKILKVEIQFPIYLSAMVVDFIGKILSRDPQKRISLEEVQAHQWMRAHENEPGRMICKEIWNIWMSFK